MEAVVSKWGSSYGVRIPKLLAKHLDISNGDKLSLKIKGDELIMRKRKTTKQIFEEFYGKPYAEISETDLGIADEIDWGEDVGGEIIR